MDLTVGRAGISNELWTAALGLLEPRYSKPIFEMWLKPIRMVDLTASEITLGVHNTFARDWLENRLRTVVLDVLTELLGYEIGLRFVVISEGAASVTPLPPAAPSAPVPVAARPAGRTSLDDFAVAPLRLQSGPAAATAAVEEFIRANLNPRYTFDEFVVGSSNRFAHAAALAVAESPARAYNPLFLYGGVGLGKTHLMHAIGHRVIEQKARANVVYVSSEKFTNEFIVAIRNNRTVEFRNKYRGVDVLLIDDIQFLEGKEQTLEEFFHTFNELQGAARQVVISSDRLPKEIETLESRLRSRFESGLLTDIQQPDLETREAILRKKADSDQMQVPDEVISFIAKSVPSNIRELEGALIRVVAYGSLTSAPVTIALAREALKNLIETGPGKTVTIALIKEKVAKAHGLTVKEMDHHRRDQRLAAPRQIAMYLAHEMTGNSLSQIAREFNKKDHTTIMYARNKVKTLIESDEAYRNKIRGLQEACRND